ncbi:hypothetical protein, partial [Rhizobium leguminosarum]|uniref:hypothetical protein n=1 Tax=Rhizobium leguminosarum TaxID=384 RepID=UPI003F94C35A
NNMPHGLVMVDAENRIQVVNLKACELLKIGAPERLKDRDLGAVLHVVERRIETVGNDGDFPARNDILIEKLAHAVRHGPR